VEGQKASPKTGKEVRGKRKKKPVPAQGEDSAVPTKGLRDEERREEGSAEYYHGPKGAWHDCREAIWAGANAEEKRDRVPFREASRFPSIHRGG